MRLNADEILFCIFWLADGLIVFSDAFTVAEKA